MASFINDKNKTSRNVEVDRRNVCLRRYRLIGLVTILIFESDLENLFSNTQSHDEYL